MVAEKVLERVGLSVHHHEKPTEVKVGDGYFSLGYSVYGVRHAVICHLHYFCDFDTRRLVLLYKSFPPSGPGIDVRVGIERCHF